MLSSIIFQLYPCDFHRKNNSRGKMGKNVVKRGYENGQKVLMSVKARQKIRRKYQNIEK
jgi:hypothetical protein